MNIVAVDCCLKITGAAVMSDGVIEYEAGELGRRQSSELPHMVERLMQKRNLSWRDVDYVALTNGPGYFTGIRVGASYASGLAYACEAEIIPVSSLDVLVHGLTGRKILTVIYAGHGFVYASCKNYLAPGEYSHEQIYSWLEKNTGAEIISDDPERTALNLDIQQVRPSVKALCEIAAGKLTSAVSPMNLQISYYRAPQGVNL